MSRTVGFSLLLLLAVATPTRGAAAAQGAPPVPGEVAMDLPSLVQGTPLVIVGKVMGIQRGRVAGEGEARLQFNDVQVSVERRLKGQSPATVTVEQVDMGGRTVLSPGIGPAFKVGERYVLFLSPGEGPRYVTGPQGRYRLEGRSVRPVGEGPVAEAAKGAEVAKFLEQIEAAARPK